MVGKCHSHQPKLAWDSEMKSLQEMDCWESGSSKWLKSNTLSTLWTNPIQSSKTSETLSCLFYHSQPKSMVQVSSGLQSDRQSMIKQFITKLLATSSPESTFSSSKSESTKIWSDFASCRLLREHTMPRTVGILRSRLPLAGSNAWVAQIDLPTIWNTTLKQLVWSYWEPGDSKRPSQQSRPVSMPISKYWANYIRKTPKPC